MSFKKRATKSIALALVGVTLAIPYSGAVSAMEKGAVTKGIEISSDFKMNFLNELENEKTNIIMPIINEDEIPKGPEARNKYLLRLVKEFLHKNKTKVVSWLRKIPGIGNKMADVFNNNLGKFISILDSWEAGVEGAVYKFWRLIFAPAQAQTATNFTMMILSFFIPGL